jgi:oxygen-independent coproporphyrinogen-3 oxidase
VPSSPPDGEPVPAAGPLPAGTAARDPFGFYLHVPFCATRCGYCDFNTYTRGELGASTDPVAYVAAARAEVRAARAALPDAPAVATVFVGGGTPTLLPVDDLAGLLGQVRDCFGLASGAEVTTEANPETVTPALLDGLLAAGFTRLSLGMQSSAAHVLAVLDRVHSPGRAVAAARAARAAGFGQVSLDLIYGTPGESADDWDRTLDAALSAGPTHVSAYALVVEDGTALARRVRRGELPGTDDDVLADRYEAADRRLADAGLPWYEVSNWGSPCRHNLGYWRSADWWGIGPGAHSHVAGTRWWNVRHPAAYAAALAEGRTPAQGREILDEAAQVEERVLLGIRLAEGLPLAEVPAPGRVVALRDDGLLQPGPLDAGRLVLTRRGRLLADTVVRALLP